jgi:hypothetical protein
MPRTLKIGIEREGRSVWLALATTSGAKRATVRTSARAAAAVATNLRAASEAEEGFSADFQIAGELETKTDP